MRILLCTFSVVSSIALTCQFASCRQFVYRIDYNRFDVKMDDSIFSVYINVFSAYIVLSIVE